MGGDELRRVLAVVVSEEIEGVNAGHLRKKYLQAPGSDRPQRNKELEEHQSPRLDDLHGTLESAPIYVSSGRRPWDSYGSCHAIRELLGAGKSRPLYYDRADEIRLNLRSRLLARQVSSSTDQTVVSTVAIVLLQYCDMHTVFIYMGPKNDPLSDLDGAVKHRRPSKGLRLSVHVTSLVRRIVIPSPTTGMRMARWKKRNALLDGGFVVPGSNAFGHSFRYMSPSVFLVTNHGFDFGIIWPRCLWDKYIFATHTWFVIDVKLGLYVIEVARVTSSSSSSSSSYTGSCFHRDYEKESERRATVEEFYRVNHSDQTYDFAKKKKEEYGKLQKAEMSIWDCIELLNGIVDESDPDLDEPQIEHLLQSAEAVRRDYPDQDCLHLTALIHGILSKSIISFDVDILCSFMTQGIRSHWAVRLTNP
ncbi:hypothetical protein BHM03_00019541 [Ensete ventricosum]|nr:hypothetical protein BHM03_00019541 [Ensete ventricosum]